MAREAEIRLKVKLDDQNVPVSMQWEATDAPEAGPKACDAVFFSLWDPGSRNTLSFDLWTSDMSIDEMNFFTLERLLKLAETHRRATNGSEVSKLIEEFCQRLTDKLEEMAKTRLGESR